MPAPRKPHLHHMLIGDGGYKSRKFIAFLISNLLLVAFAGIASYHTALVTMFPEYATGVIALFTIYLGGNIGGKFALGKSVGVDNAIETAANKDPIKAAPAAPPAPPAPKPATPGA